jgi:hypothetical protein
MKSVMCNEFKFKIKGLAKEGACRKPGMGNPKCSPSSRAGPTGTHGWTRLGPAASEPRRRATRRASRFEGIEQRCNESVGNDHTKHAKRHKEWRQELTRSADLEALSDCDNMLFFRRDVRLLICVL